MAPRSSKSRGFTVQLIGIAIAFLGLCVFGLVGVILPSRTVLNCDRSTTLTCNLATYNLFGMKQQNRDIKALLGAELAEGEFKQGVVYNLSLFAANERILFAPYLLDYASANSAVDEIAAFLSNPRQSTLRVKRSVPIMVFRFLVFTGLGATILGIYIANVASKYASKQYQYSSQADESVVS